MIYFNIKKVDYVFILALFIIASFLGNVATVFADNIPLPDFYVENLVATAEKVSYTAGNKGSVGIGDNKLELAYQFLDKSGALLATPYTWKLSNLAFPPGEKSNPYDPFANQNSKVTYLTNPPSGAVKLRLTIDNGNKISELNEENNVVETMLITSDTTGTDLLDADEGAIEAEIENEAGKEAENGTEKYDPRILPGNPLYIFKEAGRDIRLFFTFDKEKKARRELKYTNQKIVEVRDLMEKGKDERAVKHLKSYEDEMRHVVENAAKIKDTRLADILREKIFEDGAKHQVIIDRLEKNASVDLTQSIRDHRAAILENLGQTLVSIEATRREKLLRKTFDDNGSPFKPLRNIAVLRALEERVPEEARDAIKQAQENSLRRLDGQLEAIPESYGRLLTEYVDRVGGRQIEYVKILEDVRETESTREAQLEILESVDPRERQSDSVIKKIEDRLFEVRATQKQETKEPRKESVTAPPPPSPSSEPTTTESPSSTSSPREDQPVSSCSSEYIPVCGRDNLTYENECLARESGTLVQYQGVCSISRPSR